MLPVGKKFKLIATGVFHIEIHHFGDILQEILE